MGTNNYNITSQKLMESAYLQSTQQTGKKNTEETTYNRLFSDNNREGIFQESDGDIFHTGYDSSTGEYYSELINLDQLNIILNSSNFTSVDDIEAQYSQSLANISSNTNTQATAATSQSNTVHQAGTGSSKARIDKLKEVVGNLPDYKTFMNGSNGISRDTIQDWLDTNGLSRSSDIEGGFNVDDVLTYYSIQQSDAHNEKTAFWFHLLANEAWLDSGATGNNKVDGALSSSEMFNFFKDRFNIDINKGQNVSMSMINKWKEDNIAAGSDVHNHLLYTVAYGAAENPSMYIGKPDNYTQFNDRWTANNNYNNNYNNFNNNFRYKNQVLNSFNFSSSSRISNLLEKFENLGNNYDASITMNRNVNMNDLNTGNQITLYSGESYEIKNVSDRYVYLDVDGQTVRVARSSSQNGFEAKCVNAIRELRYDANTKITNSTSTNNNNFFNNNAFSTDDTSYSSYNRNLNYSKVSDVSGIINNLRNSDSYYATLTIKNKNWFDENGNTFLGVGEYEISDISNKYVVLRDNNGYEYEIPRGTKPYSFEWYCSRENTSSTNLLNAEYWNYDY